MFNVPQALSSTAIIWFFRQNASLIMDAASSPLSKLEIRFRKTIWGEIMELHMLKPAQPLPSLTCLLTTHSSHQLPVISVLKAALISLSDKWLLFPACFPDSFARRCCGYNFCSTRSIRYIQRQSELTNTRSAQLKARIRIARCWW